MAGRAHRRSRRATTRGTERDAPAVPVRTELGGYRLLRVIGRGGNSLAYLATGGDGQVVVKAYDDDTQSQRIVNEFDALTAIDSPHVVGVIDVSVDEHGPISLVLERLSTRTLADWLRDRGILDTGEVVTAAVSVVRAVKAVHAAGYVHGRVSGARIRFDDGGCPVLVGFGGAVHATAAGLAEDWRRCRTVVEMILSRAEMLEPDEVRRVLDSLGRLCDGEANGSEAAELEEAERTLFALGPPAPLVMPREPQTTPSRLSPSPSSSPTALVRDIVGAEPTSPAAADAGSAVATRPTAVIRTVDFLVKAMEHGIGGMIRDRVRGFVAGRKRAVVVGSAAAIALTVAALIALPNASTGHAQAPGPKTASESPSTPRPTTGGSTLTASPRDHTTSGGTKPAATADPAAEDPANAAFRLLRERKLCLERGDAGCLDAVDQAESPLLAADRALLSGGRSTGPAPQLSQLSLTETIGDAAVISIAAQPEKTKPASVLLIRSEAGWRLRSLFEN